MIQARGLTKRYGAKTAVDGIDFVVRPGQVTGFLGPNGAGKSTTMRMIVGLDRPSAGTVTVNGRPYREHRAPLHEVGVLLDAKAVHTGRSARNHLRALAATHRIPTRRVDEVIELTGLTSVARKRVGGFSLGMGQRLGIAAALLGDPETLILDEPVNGLDPEGVYWVRGLVRQLAAEGRTVLLSSHLMSEMALTADHLIVLGKGRVIADAAMSAVVDSATHSYVRVVSPRAAELARVLTQPDVTVTSTAAEALEIRGLAPAAVGDAAAAHGIALHELTPVQGSLEEAYMALTRDEVEYRTSLTTPAGPTAPAAPTTPAQTVAEEAAR
ncbi:multidrug ABC transporter ATP-binding protein [Cnuibacter physcomitrellae]|uniref:Multidrug ABC transporter ATP-binding protein n=1 Tax=Cnuibacter physcomitrellae TaxID=1619308 RepID=A0A1X9LR82_9MICO|nr:ABC transporter ATP-binding protein [Cnuibacter physcomitrellae]ARJ04410.1 multidrug ABC transporter ATP-binding protein [Cnuibacter physcomitrellae]GGI40982.1 multidrug ABC transporter ATP-binding protein [Cnuibacter physcomitrellae]